MNGKLASAIGALVLAGLALFGFISGVPWVPKAEHEDMKATIREIQQDVREIRTYLLGKPGGRR